jgi:hypothetical protein
MNPRPKTVSFAVPLLTTLLLVASGAMAQERFHTPDPNVMVRLSYDNSGVEQSRNPVHVCIAVSRDGEYRFVQALGPNAPQDVPAARYHGKMSKEELRQLTKLIQSDELRDLSGSHGSLIRQTAESFAAEIPFGNRSGDDDSSESPEARSWRLQWVNGDGENPFSGPVLKLVDWLKDFQPKNARGFEYSDYADVCPVIGFRRLRPSISENSQP